jgi:hypothetical protein
VHRSSTPSRWATVSAISFCATLIVTPYIRASRESDSQLEQRTADATPEVEHGRTRDP